MHALTSAPLPAHDEKTDAVVLYSEEILIVQPNGKLREIDRQAYKILRPTGRHFGRVTFAFDSETKITNIHGWCIPAQGKDFEVKDKDTTEKSYFGEALMDNLREKVMQIPMPDPGNIIGYEVEHEVRPYILDDEWYFQSQVPVALARYTLQLPAGWEYKAVWINHPEIKPTSTGGNQWQWEVRDVPEIKEEERMPPYRGVAAGMMVAFLPPNGVGNAGFVTWAEMGKWEANLAEGRRTATPEIKQKVAELTAQAPTTLAKMNALAKFMQSDIRYVAIELGIGGWQPHAAADAFTHKYGDCKDKATLLSTMLKEIGVDSYYVVINTERGGVTPATPPHFGIFNHVVLAIRVPDGVDDPSLLAVVKHPKLGRLLYFDPTDEVTPFGELNGALQANYALLVTPDGGELTPLPQLSTATNGIRRTGKFSLAPDGTLSGTVVETRVGDAAWRQRWTLRDVDKDADRIKPIEAMMSSSIGAFQITKATVSNLHQTSLPFGYDWTFVAPNYAKSAGNMLLVRPRVLGNDSSGILETKEPRKYPVEFEGPMLNADTYEIKLPPGYTVDDLPPPTDAEYSFGRYHSRVEVSGDTLRYTRSLEIKELSVPAEKTEDLKKFYRIIATDERNVAVLKLSGQASASAH